MNKRAKRPFSLNVVAILFVLGGILALIEILVAYSNNRLKLDSGVLGFFIGPGLIALRPFWRTCALVLLWISMIGLPLFSLVMLTHAGPVDFTFFGQKVGQIPKGLAIVGTVAFFALAVWKYRVLTRADVRALFQTDHKN